MSDKTKAVESVLGLVAAGGIFLYLTGRLDSTIDWVQQQGAPPRPAEQDKVMAVITDYAARYASAANDIVRDRQRKERDNSVCAAIPSLHAANWVAKVQRVDRGIDGSGMIRVTLNSHITLTTVTTSPLDTERTRPQRGTPLAEKLDTFREGQNVVISGDFPRNTDGCMRENSLTDSGSLRDPTYLFRFTAMEPAGRQ